MFPLFYSIFPVIAACSLVYPCRRNRALFMVRTVFRLNESAQGVFGYLFTHEIPFGTLEFAPIVVAVGLLAVFTPTLLAKIDHAMVKSYGTEEGEPVRNNS